MKALIIVDLQNDFLPGGALAVPQGNEIVPVVNRLQETFDIVVATQDWHPADHGSFAANHPGKKVYEQIELNGLPQTLWPTHCVQKTRGAELVPGLNRTRITKILQKGTDAGVDSYSGLFDNGHRKSTGLGEWLRERGVTEVFVCGLATDYCVKFTALDAAQFGFKTSFIKNASRGVNVRPGDVADAITEMKHAGVSIVTRPTFWRDMAADPKVNHRERVLGGLWGSLVGDALGVPVEFRSRLDVRVDPVQDMRGYGSHRQPPGTWSDDSSLLLCTIESLLRNTLDTEDMGKRFLQWRLGKLWTPHGQVFDIGIATSKAIQKISEGVRAESAGGDSEYSNGNGSLMRIIPVALRFAASEIGQALEYVHRSSAITHRHPRSQIACGLFTLLVRELLTGAVPTVALQNCLEKFHGYYGRETWWAAEFDEFSLILKGDLGSEPESAISSDGYVVDTLTASIWCLLTTRSFEECVLKAVNLGGDTDTTGCVAGGLAGVHYGLTAIRRDWINILARSEEIDNLFGRFADISRE